MHGGPKGFDDVDWDVIHPTQATLFSSEEMVTIGSLPSSVVFSHISPDGDQGFPGTLKTEVLVGLVAPGVEDIESKKEESLLGSILFVYRAKLLEEGKVTPINLTQVSCCLFRSEIFSYGALHPCCHSTGASISKLASKVILRTCW